jgi:hypothetical protein
MGPRWRQRGGGGERDMEPWRKYDAAKKSGWHSQPRSRRAKSAWAVGGKIRTVVLYNHLIQPSYSVALL